MTEVNVTLVQFGISVQMSDVILEDSPVDAVMAAASELGERIAQVEDEYIQNQIDAGTGVIYCSTDHSSTATLDATDLLIADYVAEGVAKLRANKTRTYDGKYIMVSHPFALHDLKQDPSSTGLLEASKYAAPERIFKGEVGEINGARVIESPYIQVQADAGSSTADVYYNFMFGKDSYGVVNNVDNGIRSYVRMPESQDGDELAQRGSVGVKLRVGAAILKQDGLFRLECVSTLGAN